MIDIGEYRGARVEIERDVGKLPIIYRHLTEAKYAEDFVADGSFRLSTAGTCKVAEGDGRQDKDEGTAIRHVSSMSSYDQRAAQLISETGAFNVVPPGMTFTNCTFNTLSDALLLCLTDLDTPEIRAEFGSHSIQISRLDKFFWALVHKMSEEVSLAVATLARVRYGDRVLRDYERASCPPMYRKPERFRYQNEIRIAFRLANHVRSLRPIVLECSEVKKYCKLVERPS